MELEEQSRQENRTVNNNEEGSSASVPKRRFAPLLVESNSYRSLAKNAVGRNPRDPAEPSTSLSRKIKPQLIETTKDHRGGKQAGLQNLSSLQRRTKSRNSTIPGPEPSSKRFHPQLVETAKRSVRRSPPNPPSHYPQDHNRIQNAEWNTRPLPTHVEESRFSYASLRRRQEKRQHSFRVPDLPVIQSNSSQESLVSAEDSVTTSHTFLSEKYSQAGQSPKSQSPEAFMEVNLDSLPAETRERLLKERTLAAFPNEQVHQPVAHFAIDKEDEEPSEDDILGTAFRSMTLDLSRCRRESSTELTWELEEMRRHKHESEMRAREKQFTSAQSQFSAAALASKRMMEFNAINSRHNATDAGNKRRAVRPPMLGSDIVFPLCESPQTTKCETDQAPKSHHRNTGSESPQQHPSPLWTPDAHSNVCEEPGLWHGTCNKKLSESDTLILPSPRFLVSKPAPENAMCIEVTTSSTNFTNLAVPGTTCSRSHLEQRGEDEDKEVSNIDILDEFDDNFVTQIYNYLSLGYPCLARDYDEEIGLVTGISLEELQQDDKYVNAKGYLGAPERSQSEEPEKRCARWAALKLYIHEWASRQPRSTNPGFGPEGWGVRPRGSWAV